MGVHLDVGGRGLAGDALQRRRESRIECLKPIYVRPCAHHLDEKFFYSRLLDCSPHGVCVVVPKPLEPREQFLLKLRFQRLTLVLYTVRNCTEADYSGWRVGAEFREIVGASEADAAQVVYDALLNQPDRLVPRLDPRVAAEFARHGPLR
jgi:hypothetical protein